LSFEFYYSTYVPGGPTGVPQNMTWFSRSDTTVPADGHQHIDVLIPLADTLPGHTNTFANPPIGSYIYLTAIDDNSGTHGIANSRFSTPTSINTPPMISGDALTPQINEGDSAVLSGQLVDPDAGDVLGLRVNWGDGTPTQTYFPGLQPFALPHRYEEDGSYNAQFTWFDNHGGSNTRTRQVVVAEVAPTLANASLTLLREKPGQGVFLFSAQVVNPGGDKHVRVQIDLGDGLRRSVPVNRQGEVFLVHLYKKAGPDKATVTVTDGDGSSTPFVAVASGTGFTFVPKV
jgi:hypothetical protein